MDVDWLILYFVLGRFLLKIIQLLDTFEMHTHLALSQNVMMKSFKTK